MYLQPTPAARRLGVLTIAQQQANALWARAGGRGVPFQDYAGAGASPFAPVRPPIRIVNEGPAPIYSPHVAPIAPQQQAAPPPAPAPVTANPNAGTPVPAGFPTSQIFVNSDGSFWEYGANGWVNVGTPYNTGSAATPAAPPPSPSGATTAPPAGTVAPAPVSVSVAAPSSGYQEVLDWLTQDTLAASIGFSFPNWISGGAIALLLYKVSQGTARKRNPRWVKR